MCGIAGFLAESWRGRDVESRQVLRSMGDSIAYRGPDAEGYWVDSTFGICMVHRRLSIIDLTEAGAQPMQSRSGRYILLLNGEIYNHAELRQRFEGPWRGTSDTEVFLEAIDNLGIVSAIKQAVGMFACAVWDKHERTLTLGRDRMGEKPLYYGWQGCGSQKVFLFASELPAICAHPSFIAEINRTALANFMRYNNVGGDQSIYRGINKLRPGCLLVVDQGGHHHETLYWSVAEAAISGVSDQYDGSDTDAILNVENLLRQSVQQQMLADVPVGAFLSGGVDSSLITALMQEQSSTPVRTFSIGFEEEGYNESKYARAVARHLGTEHTEMFVTVQDALEIVPQLPEIFSEPFADSSQLPTYLLAKLTREHVTVALSGDGGDELFGGYNRHQFAHSIWPKIRKLPQPVRGVAAQILLSASHKNIDRVAELFRLKHYWNRLSEKSFKAGNAISSSNRFDLYNNIVSHWQDPSEIVLGDSVSGYYSSYFENSLNVLGESEWIMSQDMIHYLPNDILTKVDRAAMAVSLEARIPMLDYRLVEFAWRLPMSMKLRNGTSKWVLREILYRHVPQSLIDRPKTGFAVPIGDWLRGPLRDWAEDLLEPTLLKAQNYLRPEPIQKAWTQHLSGKRDLYAPLWNILMFQAWLRTSKAAL
ncbi:MAG: asparagine synthase (glutamine-hydrolyzing) [Sphingorhabdus sp.]